MSAPAELAILVEDLPESGALQRLWLSLECQSDASFFTSWGWIGTWVGSLPRQFHPRLLRVTQGDALIGLAVLVDRKYWRHRLIPVTETHLNATGSPHYDSLTIEYNDILWCQNIPENIKYSVLDRLVRDHIKEELHAPGVQPESYWSNKPLTKICFSIDSKECNGVDLSQVRVDGDYLRLISANTRTKIRKVIKALHQGAGLNIRLAEGAPAAEAMYEDLVRLHQQTWVARGKPGAFSNQYVYDFHLQLIRNRLPFGEIQLLSTYSGEKLLGVLYNFVYRGRVYNYQSGIDYTDGNDRLKPGLVIHSMAIEFCARAGFSYYDLMAGDTQYKRSLGTRTNNLNWQVFQKSKLKFKFENQLRHWKQLVF